MEKIRTDIEKNRDLRKITLDLYMRNLRLLNGNKTFDNLDFLLKRSDIEKKLDELANTTKRSYIATIIVALKTDEKKYKKEIDRYKEREEYTQIDSKMDSQIGSQIDIQIDIQIDFFIFSKKRTGLGTTNRSNTDFNVDLFLKKMESILLLNSKIDLRVI